MNFVVNMQQYQYNKTNHKFYVNAVTKITIVITL